MSVFKFAIALHLVLPFSGQCFADPVNAYEGFIFDSDQTSGIIPWGTPTGRASVEYATLDGGTKIYSYVKESSKGALDGGINLWGNPVSVVLATDKDDETMGGSGDYGVFNIWKRSKYVSTNPAAKPLFEVDSISGSAVFDSVNVSVNNGSLSVGGSPVVTAGGFDSALALSTPPHNNALWANVFVPRGTVSNGGFLASGSAQATGQSAIAFGLGTTKATGSYSQAHGLAATASGEYSYANGTFAAATGTFSSAKGFSATASNTYSVAWGMQVSATAAGGTAIGQNLNAQSYYETVFGAYNSVSPSPSGTGWVATDSLFKLGNGTSSTDLSDAVTVRKNGQTTLINKAWKSGTSGPLEDPGATDDASGEALVVDGHARLRGKVIIEQAQGDIGMGIYQ